MNRSHCIYKYSIFMGTRNISIETDNFFQHYEQNFLPDLLISQETTFIKNVSL
jgi:hypothetical protein